MKVTRLFAAYAAELRRVALAAICTAAVPFPSFAAYWDWKGKASGISYFDDTGCWYKKGTTTFASSNHNISNARSHITPGWDNTITFRTVTELTGNLYQEYADAPVFFVAEEEGDGINSTYSLYVQSGAELRIQSGTYRFDHFELRSGSVLTLEGGALKATKDYSQIGVGGAGVLNVGTGASYDNLECVNGNLTLGQDSGSSGVLNIAGGSVTVWGNVLLCYNSGAVQADVNITDGGVLTAGRVHQSYAGTNGGTLTLDGGTLRAYADNVAFLDAFEALHVYVGADGGTFDTAGFAITIGEDIEDVTGAAGVLRFAGGGKATFTGTASHTGGTVVEAGTTLALTATSKASVFANAVSVAIPSSGAADGATVLELSEGAFTQGDVAAIAVTGDATGRYALVLAENGAKIAISDTLAGEYVWNGGASGASWRAAGQWSKNGVAGNWYDSTAAVFANAGDAATVDSDVAAASVTFRANASVSGPAMLSATEVAVSNGVTATISAATSGVLAKTGPGTLALASSRADATTLAEGTLVLSGEGVSLDGTKLTLGTDAGKPVSLRLENGASLGAGKGAFDIASVAGGTASLYNEGDWSVGGLFNIASGENASGEYIHARGTLTAGNHIYVGANNASDSSRSYLEVSGGAVALTAAKHIYIGCFGLSGCRSEMLVKGDGRVDAGTSLIVGNRAGATLTLTNDAYVATGSVNKDGYVAMSYHESQNGEACTLNLFGGTLETRYITHGSGAGAAHVNFDGGTLKATERTETLMQSHDKLDVTVGPKGGRIDASGRAVQIAEPLTGTGGMTFAGGGTVTLAVAPAYAGGTTVELGTTFVVPSAIDGADLVVTIPEGLASGIYKVVAISGGGTFADDILSTASLPSGNLRFFLNEGKTEIWCTYSSLPDAHVWIGGTSGSLGDGANWLSGSVPADGTAVIGSAAAASLTNPERSGFAATAIVFPANSASVSVSGAALAGIVSVVNSSESPMEFLNAVAFASDIDVAQVPGAIKFTGGATGVKLARATDIHGTYTLTVAGNHIEISGTTVKSDGVYLLPNGAFYKHNGDFHVEAGGKAEVNAARIASKTEAVLLGTNGGEFKVNGEFLVEGDGGTSTHYTGGGTDGVFLTERIRIIQGGRIVPPAGKTVFGSGGILRGSGYIRLANNGAHEFGAYADWAMYWNARETNTDTANFVIYKHNSTTWTTLTFDTTDWYDKTVGRTITCEAPIGAENAASAGKFRVVVKGMGTFEFKNTYDGNIFSGGLTVSDSATVAVVPNAWPGKGGVTLEDASTLKVARSGTVTVGGELVLGARASLAFNFTDKRSAPVLSGTSVAVSGDAVNVKLTAADGVDMNNGTFALTSGMDFSGKTVNLIDKPDWVKGACIEDGNIVLSVKQRGFKLIIK